MNRRHFLKHAAAGSAGLIAGSSPLRPAPASRPPNILYIMSDDHAAHMLSCYGSRIASTPNLDRIAREGIRFQNSFCTNSLCGPSRATLLTGKYSHLNGFRRNGDKFDGSQQTFPKLLREAGYQTAMIGKWHLASDPTGFDYWHVLPGQGIYFNPPMIEMGRKVKHQGYVTDIITDLSLDWLKRRNPAQPFLLMCHHKATHGPWTPDAKHAHLFDGTKIPEPPTFNDDFSHRTRAIKDCDSDLVPELRNRFSKAGNGPPPGLSEQAQKEWVYQRYVKEYMRTAAAMDDNVGRLLAYLDEAGLAKDTLVVYTSDNGMFMGDHGLFDKRFMYEEPLHVPLLVRHPRAIRPGSVTRKFSLNLDYAPTLLDYGGLKTPSDMQGRSLRPVLEGREPADWRTSIYYHYYEHPSGHNVYKNYGVRTARHKLIHYYDPVDEWELFDLRKDPREMKSVYDDPAYASTRRELKAELDRLRKELRVTD